MSVTEIHKGQHPRTLSRVADPHHFNADPDPAFHLKADPDPSFHFNADLDPAFQVKRIRILFIVSVHGPLQLRFEHLKHLNCLLQCGFESSLSLPIRIKRPKIMQIRIRNPDLKYPVRFSYQLKEGDG